MKTKEQLIIEKQGELIVYLRALVATQSPLLEYENKLIDEIATLKSKNSALELDKDIEKVKHDSAYIKKYYKWVTKHGLSEQKLVVIKSKYQEK